MRGLQKSKRVSWASDVNLCQVKLFLSEESPSLIGLGGQDHLQAKASWPPYTTGAGHDDNLPPGFEESHPANILHNKLSEISVIQWQCPPKFAYDPNWQVVDGDESKEVDRENEREMRVLEAVYPRPSSIPPNPSLLIGVDSSYDPDQQQPPLIPITPIEDDDAGVDTFYDTVPPNIVPISSQPQQHAPQILHSQSHTTSTINPPPNFIPPAAAALGVEPRMITAAYNALNAVMANSGQVTAIDPDLLLTILKDPNFMEKLGSSHGTSTSTQNLQKPMSQSNTLPEPQLVHINRTEPVPSSLAATPSRPFYPPTGRPGPIPNLRPHTPEVVTMPPPQLPPPRVPVAKDINYYKSLIQQHGGERQEPMPQFNNNIQMRPSQGPTNDVMLREYRPRIMKPCMYFNSPRGCRNGANCAYQHDVSAQQRVNGMPEVQSAKRMKMDRELTGT